MMENIAFHFSQPVWLWALTIPLVVWLGRRWRLQRAFHSRFRAYADPALLPHLVYGDAAPSRFKRYWLHWLLCWLLGVVAMAGPRWDYRDIRLFEAGTELLILLDLSASMQVTDVQPNRLARARQEIQDLLEVSQGIRLGLVAFASFSHVVVPITEDHEAFRRMLPFLNTDLVRWPGSRLHVALDQAERLWLGQDKAQSRHILLISDGDFAAVDTSPQIQRLRALGIYLHVIGVGTVAGGAVLGPQGAFFADAKGQPVRSSLQEVALRKLAALGGGYYVHGDYRDADTQQLIKTIRAKALARQSRESKRVWEERYYFLVALLLLLCLPYFRRRL